MKKFASPEPIKVEYCICPRGNTTELSRIRFDKSIDAAFRKLLFIEECLIF